MSSFADNLARLRVAAATGRVAPEVARWAVQELELEAPRTHARDELLRQAAALMGGSRWARARRLEREIGELTSLRLRQRAADVDGVRDLVARALALDPGLPPPRSHRQLLRILAVVTP